MCVIVLLAVAAGAVSSFAQDMQRKEPSGTDASTSALPAQLLKTGLYMFSSDTGNSSPAPPDW